MQIGNFSNNKKGPNYGARSKYIVNGLLAMGGKLWGFGKGMGVRRRIYLSRDETIALMLGITVVNEENGVVGVLNGTEVRFNGNELEEIIAKYREGYYVPAQDKFFDWRGNELECSDQMLINIVTRGYEISKELSGLRKKGVKNG